MELVSYPHIAAFSREQAGGKGAQLAQLAQLGLAVPAWQVLPAQAFSETLEQNKAHSTITSVLSTLQQPGSWAREEVHKAATELGSLIMKLEISPEWTVQLEQAIQHLTAWAGPTRWQGLAVRSSVCDEDGDHHSFAGQMDSFLYQQSLPQVIQSIKSVWASAFGERALFYRLQHGLPVLPTGVAVILQAMIPATAAGVLFTANPNNGVRNQALVTAGYGVGEGVVGGTADTDEYVYDFAEGREVQRHIAPKEQAVAPATGSGTQIVAVEEERKNEPVLLEQQIAHLCQQSLRVARAQGSPQDIEWAFDGEQFWFLQTRPITSLPATEKMGQRRVWDNSNIQESYNGVTTPLTFSFANFAYAMVYEQTTRLMGLPEPVIAEHRPILRNLLGLVKGRIYYNINNWYRGLLLLPSFKQNKGDMERMMGLQDPVDFVEDKVLPWGQRIRKLPRLLVTLVRLLNKFRQMNTMVQKFHARFWQGYAEIDRNLLPTYHIDTLWQKVNGLTQGLMMHWQTPILNDFYVMMMNGRLFRALENLGFDDAAALQNDLLSGESGIESTAPTKAIIGLAEKVRAKQSLSQVMYSTPTAKLHGVIALEHPTFYAACEAYIEQYGDRTMGELKLETLSLREDPAFLYQTILQYVGQKELTLEKLHQRERHRREEAEKRVTNAAGPWPWQKWRVARLIKQFRQSVKHRENTRFQRTRLFGLYRSLFREIGQRLTTQGMLENPGLVFYLTLQELEAYMEGRSVQHHLNNIAQARQQEFTRFEEDTLPHHFETFGPPDLQKSYEYKPSQEPQESDTPLPETGWQGIGCYPGVVEAPVRLVHQPNEALNLEGHILVAERTDPGWAPLFPVCKGILVERGSTLSHSAVVARELGIPAVVGARGVLQGLKDGQVVRLNGAKGTVEPL